MFNWAEFMEGDREAPPVRRHPTPLCLGHQKFYLGEGWPIIQHHPPQLAPFAYCATEIAFGNGGRLRDIP